MWLSLLFTIATHSLIEATVACSVTRLRVHVLSPGGVQVGDEIMMVDGQHLQRKPLEAARDLLRRAYHGAPKVDITFLVSLLECLYLVPFLC